MISTVPFEIKRAFRLAEEPISGQQQLWRERAARMTLDALGHTNLTVKPHRHNDAVRYARRWFKQFFAYANDDNIDNAEATFDFAGIPFDTVRKYVLQETPILFETADEYDDEEEDDAT
jgi:hypothetical protein